MLLMHVFIVEYFDRGLEDWPPRGHILIMAENLSEAQALIGQHPHITVTEQQWEVATVHLASEPCAFVFPNMRGL